MKAIKLTLCITIITGFMSCMSTIQKKDADDHSSKVIQIRDAIMVYKDSLVLNGNEGNWYYNNQLFSGYSVRYHNNDSLKEKIGFYNGKKEGIAKTWFDNGILKTESHYQKNKLVGRYKAWWNNAVLASEAYFENGQLEGLERKWYNTGTLAKQRNLANGREHGIQQAWLKNGKLYVNYEAKNGRVFGMKRANSCYKLENEKVITKQ